MQPCLPVVVLPRQPQVVLDRIDRHRRLAERLVDSRPDDRAGTVGHGLRRAQSIDVVVDNLRVVVDPGQGPSIEPDVDLGVAGLILLPQQFAIGAVVEDGGETILVDLFDALAGGVVAVSGGLACRLAGGEAVEAVIGEAGGAGTLGVAVGGAGTRLAAFLVEPVGLWTLE